MSVLLGNGDGTFPNPPHYATGNSPTSVAVGDFNGDGKPDLAVPSFDLGISTVSVLLGNGDGTFQPHMDSATGQAPMSVAVGDFNGDGKPDLVTANYRHHTVSVLLGNGDGTFRAHVDYATGSYATSWRWATSTATASPIWRSPNELRRQHGERAAGQRRRHLPDACGTSPPALTPPRGGGGLQRRRQARLGHQQMLSTIR